MRAGGMLAFNTGIITDHRGLWVDLDIPSLLKGSIPPSHNKTTRRAPKTNQKHKCKELRVAITGEVQSQNLPQKIHDLSNGIHYLI